MDEKELLKHLRALEIEAPPSDLSRRVMQRIHHQQKGLFARVWTSFTRTRSISFRPIYAFGLTVMVCGAFLIDRNAPEVSPPVEKSTIEPAMYSAGMLEDPEAAYLVGRGLLKSARSEGQALHFFKRAALLDPDNAEYAYWEGVGHWINGEQEQEQLSYIRGLETDPGNIPLLINLGHSYLAEKKYQRALDAYGSVLAQVPDEAVALYNSGLIYRQLNMTDKEIAAWRTFLQKNRLGTKAFRAVSRLNRYGDYSFRVYHIGARKVIVNQDVLLDDSVSDVKQAAELETLAAILERNSQIVLEIVVFVNNDLEMARQKARDIRDMISQLARKPVAGQIKLSWFDEPEITQREGPGSVAIGESVLLFSHLMSENTKEVSI